MPDLCSEELNGLVGALEMVKLTPGKDFKIVVASIDPSETPAIAASQEGHLCEALRPAGDGRTAGTS